NDGAQLQSFAPGDPVGQPCDGRLTVRVGPADDAGRLENWELRPPGACGRIAQCGYVSVRLLGAAGLELATASAASVHVPLDVTGIDLGSGYRITAELRRGTSGEVFTLIDEATGEPAALMADTPLTLEARTCPEPVGTGGAGGASGMGGSAGEGGLGGLGGMAGSLP